MPTDGTHYDWFADVAYHRGMKRVEVPHAGDVWEQKDEPCELCRFDPLYVRPGNVCPSCRGTRVGKTVYRPTAWAKAVCRCHPDVVELWIDDREPYPDFALTLGRGAPDTFDWHSVAPPDGITTAVVPQPVFDAMKALRPNNTTPMTGGEALEFPSAGAATTALARAVVRWVRSFPEAKA